MTNRARYRMPINRSPAPKCGGCGGKAAKWVLEIPSGNNIADPPYLKDDGMTCGEDPPCGWEAPKG